MEPVKVGTVRHSSGQNWHTVSALIEAEGEQYDIFVRSSHGPLADGTETFLGLALLPAMKLGASLHVEGRVSPQFFTHAMRIQDIVTAWNPELRRIPIEVIVEPQEPATASRGVGCFFSGGVDSFFTALKHQQEITHLIFVYGLDLALEKKALRTRVARAIEQAATELGKPLIQMETNLRSLFDVYGDWTTYGANTAQALLALLLAPQMEAVYIAGGLTYQHLRMAGMNHPLVYQMWSTSNVEIVDDGRDVSRYEKIRRIAQSETALRWLRVCWENRNDAYNCGYCSKCLQTMVFLQLAGVLDRCRTFEHGLDLAALRCITLHSPPERAYFEEALTLAEKDGRYPELVEALRDVLGVTEEAHPDSELQGQLHRAERRVRELEAELYYLTSSRSWRWTAPLRAAAEATRALKRRL